MAITLLIVGTCKQISFGMLCSLVPAPLGMVGALPAPVGRIPHGTASVSAYCIHISCTNSYESYSYIHA